MVVFGGRDLFGDSDSSEDDDDEEWRMRGVPAAGDVCVLHTRETPMRWQHLDVKGISPGLRTGHSCIAMVGMFGEGEAAAAGSPRPPAAERTRAHATLLIQGGLQPESGEVFDFKRSFALELL